MTREQAKELLPIIQAFAEGKTIQYRVLPPFSRIDKRDTSYLKEWIDIDEDECIGFSCDGTIDYRVKPEQKYRPFKSQEECWNEMLKHQPFGWIKYSNFSCIIQNISLNGITVIKEQEIHYLNFEEHFMNIKFNDGTPFGIKEDI